MRTNKCLLNNMSMDNLRKDKVYQAIVIDLVLTGNLSKEDARRMLGYDIPEYLHLPKETSVKVAVKDEHAKE